MGTLFWAGDVVSQKSTSCYVFQVNTSAVFWSSNQQFVFALSSTEVEYITLFLAAQGAIWLPSLLKDTGFTQQKPPIMLEDRATLLVKNPKFH